MLIQATRTLIALAVLLMASMAWAQAEGQDAAPASPPPPAEPASGEFSELYRIGVDDRLQVSVWRNPELSVTVPVRPDGRISVPLVGDVMAGGRAPQEVAADIEKQLATYVRDPKVAVILVDLRSHEFISRVRVTGAVRQPVSVPYRQGMTVLDAVLQAGGVTDFAAANRSRLHRRDADGAVETRDIRLGDILDGGKLESNLDVRPGDVITVPERAL
jgi:polysaccharide export outer membrane protein